MEHLCMPISKVNKIEKNKIKGKFQFSDFKQGKMHLGPVFKNVSISHFWWRVQCETQEILIFLLHVSKPTDLNNGLKNCFTHQFECINFATLIFLLCRAKKQGAIPFELPDIRLHSYRIHFWNKTNFVLFYLWSF